MLFVPKVLRSLLEAAILHRRRKESTARVLCAFMVANNFLLSMAILMSDQPEFIQCILLVVSLTSNLGYERIFNIYLLVIWVTCFRCVCLMMRRRLGLVLRGIPMI